MTGTHPQFEHERYEELCALATAGALTAEESEALFAHVDDCAECSEVFAQYESLATGGMPLLASQYAAAAETTVFNEEPALARLLHTVDDLKPKPALVAVGGSNWNGQPLWRGLIAASLLIGVAFAAYKIGERKRPVATAAQAPAYRVVKTEAEQKSLDAALLADQRRIAELEAEAVTHKGDADKQRAEVESAQAHLDSLTASLSAAKADSASQIAALTQERDASAARLQAAQQSYQTVEYELNTVRSQHKQDLFQVASLEDKVNGLTAALNDDDRHTKNDEQYLASDKDIRDLIGARNLYIADIMDVDESGKSRKPFGRVFYTKTKSLIFYAYDLDHQPGVKEASTFQVWGTTSMRDGKPVNLGVLYMDSATNRRWTLRVDDPQQLAQLNSIFVTVEPHGASQKPTGKRFLYASLVRDANHP